jgi:hypothetical protein
MILPAWDSDGPTAKKIDPEFPLSAAPVCILRLPDSPALPELPVKIFTPTGIPVLVPDPAFRIMEPPVCCKLLPDSNSTEPPSCSEDVLPAEIDMLPLPADSEAPIATAISPDNATLD